MWLGENVLSSSLEGHNGNIFENIQNTQIVKYEAAGEMLTLYWVADKVLIFFSMIMVL